MTANVTFIYAEKSDVLRVPNAALALPSPERAAAPSANASGSAVVAASAPAAMGGAAAPMGGARRKGAGAGAGGSAESPTTRTVWMLREARARAVPIRSRHLRWLAHRGRRAAT